ncbi:hypothetical protein Tco_0643760 [Tanacetum coccineum]
MPSSGLPLRLAISNRSGEPKLYIPGASTLGVSEVEGHFLVVTSHLGFQLGISAVKALKLFSVRSISCETVGHKLLQWNYIQHLHDVESEHLNPR